MTQEKTDLRDKSGVVRFLFAGRLVREKGFDRVIAVAKKMLEHEGARATLSIYGEGPLRKDMIRTLSCFSGFLDASDGALPQGGEKVVYFWHRGQKEIKNALFLSHYMLMPSRFLETFGLSALEAISYGVPVIGFKKGGLSQFLLSEHALSDTGNDARDNDAFVDMAEGAIAKFSGSNWHRQSLTAKDIASKYSPEHWRDQVLAYLGGPKRILLVSDYLAPIGWIETHVATIAGILRDAWCEVRLFGWIENHPSKLRRMLGLLVSSCNFLARFRLAKALREFSPEAVWCHSVARSIGPVGLLPLVDSKVLKIKTYHDLWYFGPYATAFERESDLGISQDFESFYKRAPLFDKILPFYLLLKFSKLKKLAVVLRSFDLHFVPSDFMTGAVHAFLGSEEARVVTLPHAINLWK